VQYRNQLFIASTVVEPSKKIGYRVMLVRLEGDRVTATSRSPRAGSRERSLGPPVDVLVMPTARCSFPTTRPA